MELIGNNMRLSRKFKGIVKFFWSFNNNSLCLPNISKLSDTNNLNSANKACICRAWMKNLKV